ncbi:MAG: hypothetical protein FJ209_04090 [Betaproteobacteria bacterium]|nr:hypothetical protein [Betaproteobacteria bacterium]
MLIALIVATLLAFLAGQALPKAIGAAPAFWAHLVLAVGVMSLITAAMQHFVPVLARGRGAGPWTGRLPYLMLASGLLSLAVFHGLLDFAWIALPAGLALAGAVAMLAWMRAMGRKALGKPHAGLAWYLAAMACLGLGLAAAMLIPLFPDWHAGLRAFHVHINLYGFVAITAVGTLQVLMPTAANQADPEVAGRLRTDLKWALSGSLLLATGQALMPPLAWLGGLLWTWVMARMLLAWWRLHRSNIFAWHGAEPVLAAAAIGFLCALAGTLLGPDSLGPLTLFLPGFLMPLVTGAAGQLAPVWVEAGRGAARHAADRARITRWNGPRALLFLTAALLPLFGYKCAGMPALTALVWFGIVFAIWLYRDSN